MKTFPRRMTVWFKQQPKCIRLVLAINTNGQALGVYATYEAAYAAGEPCWTTLWDHYAEIGEESPEKRRMTRDEILGFLANTPGVLVRYRLGNWSLPAAMHGAESFVEYQWTTIDKDGIRGEPMEFEK